MRIVLYRINYFNISFQLLFYLRALKIFIYYFIFLIVEETPTEVTTPTEITAPTEVNELSIVMDGPETVADITVDQESLDKLKTQQQKYKVAAVAWKRAGNKEQAIEYAKTAKQFDIVIAAVAAGEKLDLSDMPPSPTLPAPVNTATLVEKEESEVQQQASTDTSPIGEI